MNGYALTAEIVKAIASLAWPAAIFGAVYLFRQKLAELLPLFRARYKDFEVSFRLDKAEQEAASLPPAPDVPDAQPTPEEKSRFEQLADISPRAAILELRSELEEAVSQLVERHMTYAGKAPLTLLTGTRLLRANELIDAKTSALLDDLRVIGNQAAHSNNTVFTKQDAMRFRALADEIVPRLRDAALKAMLE